MKRDIKKLDLVQISPDHDPRFGACIMVVTRITNDGPMGYISVPDGDVAKRAYYICPWKACVKVGTAEWVAKEDADEQPEKHIPYIGFTNERLAKCPPAKAGDKVECLHCGGEHVLEPAQDAKGERSELILFYKCGDQCYLGGVGGKLVANIKSSFSSSDEDEDDVWEN